MSHNLLRFFKVSHLPERLQVAARFGELAHMLDRTTADGSEKDAGMRKLLEAKDCFVRARLDHLNGEPDETP